VSENTPLYAEVLPDPGRPLDQLFTYLVPEGLRELARPGAQVLVPFGPRSVTGFLIRLRTDTDRTDLKPLEAVLADSPSLAPGAIPLAEWLAGYYCCSLGEALRPFLPQGAGRRFLREWSAAEQAIARREEVGRQRPGALPILEFLLRLGGRASPRRLRTQFGQASLERELRWLAQKGLVRSTARLLRPAARRKERRTVSLAVSQPDRKLSPKQQAVLDLLRSGGKGLSCSELARQAGVSQAVVTRLVRLGLLKLETTALRRVPWPLARAPAAAPPELMPAQAAAVQEVGEALRAGGHRVFLLFGVTASGKTEVFVRAIEQVLSEGKQAIVLLPEIALTAQALGRYRARLGESGVALLHSALSPGEHYDEWQRIAAGEAGLVLGARSAVFAPCPRLGLIVVDEEHEASYKQEQAPRYHAREVALERARRAGCPVILASATPSLESFWAAQEGRFRLLALPERIDRRPLPAVRIVDLRSRRRRPAVFSPELRQALSARLEASEQVILFLNRRGFSTFLLCPACGRSMRCPHCQVALTYHRSGRELRCHHCDHRAPAPAVCPECGSPQLRFSGVGTEKVEAELIGLFPQARVSRLDRDTTARRGAHLRIVSAFERAETDVLVGTQMVVRGFDFPGVTLVGVIAPEVSLNLPDFRAAERTFQLLTQVGGRSGRGEREGEMIIQTFHPDHYSLQASAGHDYEAFYQEEIGARRELGYPPFSHLANLLFSAPGEELARDSCQQGADICRQVAGGEAEVAILGPAPAPLARLRGRWRWHLLLKSPSRAELCAIIPQALAQLRLPRSVVLAVDLDPVSLL
jgi:primosomal protein N' (replication factor Y)